jgi:hypothetical protein
VRSGARTCRRCISRRAPVSLNVAVRLAPSPVTTIPRPSNRLRAVSQRLCAGRLFPSQSMCAGKLFYCASDRSSLRADQLWEPVRAVICACGGKLSACKEAGVRAEDFDLERIACGNV